MNHIAKAALVALVSMTGCSEDEGTPIDDRGGVVVSDDGRFTLEIPPGALDQEVVITVDEVECEQDTVVGPCYEVGPVGLPLLFPGEVAYELDAVDLDGLDLEALSVLTEREDAWQPLADRDVDMGHGLVTASAVYLSSYAVVVD